MVFLVMLTLYHAPDSRSSRFIWLLEELHADYTLVYCSIQRRSGTGAPDALNPHPDKRIPALVHDNVLVTESAAIALYLTDLMPSENLGPIAGDPDRGSYLSWLAYYAGEIEPAFASRISGQTESDRFARQSFDRVIDRVYSTLKTNEFILGKCFSAVDILCSSIFQWYGSLAPEYAGLTAWLDRMNERPASKKAMSVDFPSSAA